MSQVRRKEFLYEPETSVATQVALRPLDRRPALPASNNHGAKTDSDDEGKEALRMIVRLIKWLAVGAFGLLAVGAATGHLLAVLLVLGGLTAATALLVAWGNWILDNTVAW